MKGYNFNLLPSPNHLIMVNGNDMAAISCGSNATLSTFLVHVDASFYIVISTTAISICTVPQPLSTTVFSIHFSDYWIDLMNLRNCTSKLSQ